MTGLFMGDEVRVVVLRRGGTPTEAVVRVEVVGSDGAWSSVVKVDAFGTAPHWHLYPRGRPEIVRRLRDTGVDRMIAILRDLPQHLVEGGYAEVGSRLADSATHQELVDAVHHLLVFRTPAGQ